MRHLLTVDDFVILDEAGAFETVGRVELVDGEIFVLSPLYLPHARTQTALLFAFGDALRGQPRGWEVVAPVSAHLDDHNLPEADLLVFAGGGDTFVERSNIRLALEVAVSSLRHDLQRKASLYARMGIPEYWIADVKGRRIIRMAEPKNGAYDRRDEFPFGTRVPFATADDLVVDTVTLA